MSVCKDCVFAKKIKGTTDRCGLYESLDQSIRVSIGAIRFNCCDKKITTADVVRMRDELSAASARKDALLAKLDIINKAINEAIKEVKENDTSTEN